MKYLSILSRLKPIFLFLLLSLTTQAQNFPVEVNLLVLPPHSPAYHTFSQASGMLQSNKIQLSLTLKDLVVHQLDIGLQVELRGSSGNFNSDPSLRSLPFTLNKGFPTMLSNADLSPYLLSNGLSEAVVANSGFLREGDWEICVTAFELLNGQQVSRQSCYYMFLEDLDPPMIIFPEDSILPSYPQNIQIGWQPLHIGAFPVRYTVNIWEELDGFSDNQIVESTLPYFSKSLNQQTMDWLTIADPPMIVGREYIMQVQIEDNINGMMGPQVYAFKNNGFSQIHRFKYGMYVEGAECEDPSTPEYMIDDSLRYFVYWDEGEPPVYEYVSSEENDVNSLDKTTALSTGGVSPQSTVGSLNENNENADGVAGGSANSISTSTSTNSNTSSFAGFYKMYYREEGTGDWSSKETVEAWAEFTDFKRGRNYEIYISKICSAEERSSDAITIKIPTLPPERDFTCGMPPVEIDLSNQAPLMNLAVDDTIIAGDFRVVITEVSGSNGRYSGEGFCKMGLFIAKIAVEFDDIFVNDEYRMVDGFIKTQYDPTGSNIFNADGLADLFSAFSDPFPVIEMASFDNAEFTLTGQVTVYPGGQTYDAPLRIVTPDGDVLLTGGMILKEVEFDRPKEVSADWQVVFSPSSKQIYGYDQVDSKIKSEYKNLGDKYLDHKSVAYGGFDVVDLYVSVATNAWTAEHWDSVRIITHNKFEVEFEKPGSATKNIEVRLPGLEGEEFIYVMFNDEFMGAINLAPYKFTNYTVNLVPVNGVGENIDIEKIEKEVNEILESGVVKTTVNLLSGQSFTYQDENGEIEADTEILSAYSSDMKAVLQKHLGEHGQEENEMYLFIVDNLTSGVVGFMADGQTAGFIDIASSNLARTVAHELGHGAYTLDHFWKIYGSAYPKKSSDNLMDYNGGTDLVYKQWNRMHNQSFSTPWFKKGEDQMQIGEGKIACVTVEEVSKMKLGTTFYDGNLKAFNIPLTAIPRSFYRNDNETELQGTLHSFSDQNQIWSLHYYAGTTTFAGYAPAANPENKEFSERKYAYENIDAVGKKVIIDHIAKTAVVLPSDEALPYTDVSCDCPVGSGTGFGKSIVIDYTQTVSTAAIDKAISDLNSTQNNTGVQISLFIIDAETPDSIREAIQDQIDNISGDRYIVRLEFENDKDYKPIEVYYGILYESRTFNDFLNQAIADSKLVTKVSLDLLTDFLDGLSHIVKNLAVPERFYNPEHSKYKPFLAKMYYVSSYLNPLSYGSTTILNDIPNSGNYEPYQIEFAFTVGIYNGLINQVGDLIELPSFLIKLVTNEDGFKDQMFASFDQFKKECKEADQNWGGCAWDKIWPKIVKAHDASNSCLLAHQVGKDVSELATFMLAFAKIGKLGKASALMEKLDATTYVLKGAGILLKFSVAAGKTTFRFGKSTLFLVADVSTSGAITGWKIIREIGGQAEQLVNKGLDEFLPKPELAYIQKGNKLYLGTDDLTDWNLNELLSDTKTKIQDDFGNYLVEMKRIGSDGLEESRLILAKAIELDEFHKLLKDDLQEELIVELEKLPKSQKQVLNAGLKNADFKDWIKQNDVEGLSYWNALYNAGKTGGNNPASAVANKAGALNIFKETMERHPDLDIDVVAKIKGHSSASFGDVVSDLDALISHSKKDGMGITFDKISFDKLLLHWGNATNSQSKGVHGVIKAIQDGKYNDLFGGKKLEFEEPVPNARPNEHNSNIDITTDGEPPLRIEVKNYSGETGISSATIKEQFIERDLFNAASLDEIIWLQVGTIKLTPIEFTNYLKSNKGAINNLPQIKKETFFKGYEDLDGITNKNIEDFVNDSAPIKPDNICRVR